MNTPGNEPRDAAEAGGGWLHLAATPTFAVMALATAVTGNDPAHMLCRAMGHGPLSLGGMTLMYLLMAIFHAGPWCKWLVLRVSGHGRTKKILAPDATAVGPRCR